MCLVDSGSRKPRYYNNPGTTKIAHKIEAVRQNRSNELESMLEVLFLLCVLANMCVQVHVHVWCMCVLV